MKHEKIVYWWRNLFMVPTGKTGKEFITKITQLLKAWVHDSSLKDIAFKVVMALPSLVLQKPRKKSKTKDHGVALKHRLTLWHDGNVLKILKEGATIQGTLTSVNT